MGFASQRNGCLGHQPGTSALLLAASKLSASHLCLRACNQRFLGISAASRTIAIEPRWIEAATSVSICVYDIPAETFEPLDAHSGHFISRSSVKPTRVRVNPLAEMLSHDVELHIVKDLIALHEALANSTLSFSSTRLRHAAR